MKELLKKKPWILFAIYLLVELIVMQNLPRIYSLIFTGSIIVAILFYVIYMNKRK